MHKSFHIIFNGMYAPTTTASFLGLWTTYALYRAVCCDICNFTEIAHLFSGARGHPHWTHDTENKACKQHITTYVAFIKKIYISVGCHFTPVVIANRLWLYSILKLSLMLFRWSFGFHSVAVFALMDSHPPPFAIPSRSGNRGKGKQTLQVCTLMHTEDTAWDVSPWYRVDTERRECRRVWGVREEWVNQQYSLTDKKKISLPLKIITFLSPTRCKPLKKCLLWSWSTGGWQQQQPTSDQDTSLCWQLYLHIIQRFPSAERHRMSTLHLHVFSIQRCFGCLAGKKKKRELLGANFGAICVKNVHRKGWFPSKVGRFRMKRGNPQQWSSTLGTLDSEMQGGQEK